MDAETFQVLLARPESETIDFKATAYDFSGEYGTTNFIKDILCMANTPRSESAFIILGVKKYPDGKYDLRGLDKYIDEATLQSQFSERIYPVPEFSYEVFSYEGKDFGIITIPPRPVGPCVPLRDFGNVLRQRQIYFRRGSKNDLAMPEDINSISAWIRGETAQGIGSSESETWEEFLRASHNFEQGRRYLLISSPIEKDGIGSLSSIGKVSWTGAIDFDPNSDSTGLLSAIKPVLENHRSLHQVVAGDRPTLSTGQKFDNSSECNLLSGALKVA
jgi:hypothetical protein